MGKVCRWMSGWVGGRVRLLCGMEGDGLGLLVNLQGAGIGGWKEARRTIQLGRTGNYHIISMEDTQSQGLRQMLSPSSNISSSCKRSLSLGGAILT